MTGRPSTPAWLVGSEPGICACGCIGRRTRGGYVSKTIDNAARVLQQAVFADELAHADGALQRVDARVKLLGLVALLVTTSLVHSIAILAAVYTAVLGIALWSKIPVGLLVRRVWLSVPLFTGLIAVPATLNLVTPGEMVVPLGTWFGHPVGLTAQGLWSAGMLVTRVAVSVSLVLLVTLTTTWTRLLGAARSLCVPRAFVAVFALAYRYLFDLLATTTDLYMARRARTVRPEHHSSGRRFVSGTVGVMFAKAHGLSAEVHEAMVSRGYVGEPRMLEPPSLTATDAVAATAIVATVVLTLLGAHAIA